MNIVYFTLGESIKDQEVRTQLLRIPEVLSDLRQAQQAITHLDLLGLMGSQDLFDKAPRDFQLKLAQLMQESLFKRWKISQMPYAQLVERRKFRSPEEWRFQLKEVLQADKELHFYIFGPGFDDLENEIRKIRLKDPPKVFLHESIAEDPLLDWFWPSVVQNAQLAS